MPQSGLIQIDTNKNSEFFLVSNPEITFFTKKYRRYTQFGIDTEIINIEPINFSERVSILLSRKTGLLHKMTLEIVLPKLDLIKTNSSYNFEELELQYENLRLLYNSYNDYIGANKKLALYILELLSLTDTDNILEEIIKSDEYKFLITSSNVLCNLIDKLSEDSFIKKQKIKTMNIYKLFLSRKFDIDTFTSFINNQYQILIDYNISDLVQEYTKVQSIYFPLKNKSLVERYKSAWIDEVGHFIIKNCELYFNNQKIDNNSGIWLSIYNRLYYYKYSDDYGKFVYDKLIGNVPELTVYDDKLKDEYKLYIPLRFFFCNNPGQALPVNNLNNTEIRLDIELNDLSSLFYYEKNDSFSDLLSLQNNYDINVVSARLLAEYIVLDKLEDDKFKTSSHEYLIQTVQHKKIDSVIGRKFLGNIDSFEHPTLAFMWILQDKDRIENITGNQKCEWNKYISSEIIESMGIKYSSFDFADSDLNPEYYNYVISYKYFARSDKEGLFSFSFCLDPTIMQPTGSLNLSRFLSLKIMINFKKIIDKELIMHVYAPTYNILRCYNGYAKLAYGSTMID